LLSCLWLDAGLSGCGGAASNTPHEGGDGTRAETLGPLALPEVAEKSDPPSVLPIVLAADRAFIDALVEHYVPERLHEEKGRALGHGITLDLQVSRKLPRYTVRNEILDVELPITLDIDVGRRMGPIDLRLGSCRPNVLAKIHASTRLGPELEVSPPELHIALQDRCQLSGFDVSRAIEEEIDKQERHARRELKQRVAEVRDLVLSRRRALEDWLASTSPECPRFRPEGLFQSPLVEHDGVFSTSVGLVGHFSKACDAPPEGTLRLEQRATSPVFELAVTRRLDWATLRTTLEPALSKLGLTAPIELRSAKTAQGERVAVGLTTSRDAGWILCEPVVIQGTLTFVAKESASPTLLAAAAPLLGQVAIAEDQRALDERSRTLFDRVRALSQLHVSAPNERRRLWNDDATLESADEALVDPKGIGVVSRRRERR
jgi:hypothetical protein